MEDIGVRNSDLLLSDAVLFVEGPSDREILDHWTRTRGMNLDEHNVSVLSMGGGRNAERQAPARGEVLAGISKKSPVPHVFLLDRDERGREEIEHLKSQLEDRVYLLDRREIENYLLVPRAILAAVQEKYRDNSVILEQAQAAGPADVDRLIHESAKGLYGQVLLKRIRAEIGGPKDGLFPDELVGQFVSQVDAKELPSLIEDAIRNRTDRVISDLGLDSLVQKERRALDAEWSDPDRRLSLAAGVEILEHVYRHFGGEFNKRKDAPWIASEMQADEIDPEIVALITRLTELSNVAPHPL